MIDRIKKHLMKNTISIKRIDIIDGIRVIAIGLIAWFHIWQQSWLAPYLNIGRIHISFMVLPRAGYLWVDMFILLSAFQLFLPYAREMVLGEKPIGTKEFYKRRARRILPSYLLSVMICLYIALFSNEFVGISDMLKDLITHLTFTLTFWHETYLWTKLNVVLWTVAILVQFYLIFPLLAKAFKKQPIITFILMTTVGIVFRMIYVNSAEEPSMFINQLPAFFDVFALGFLGAYAFVLFNKKVKYQYFSPLMTLISIGSFIAIYFAMKDLADVVGHNKLQHWQGTNRFWIAVVFLLLVISTAYSTKWYRFIFSNKVMVFLSSISFNFYIWHQYIAVKLKLWNIPYSVYDMPNMAEDVRWQHLYTLLSFVIPLVFAWLITWLYENKLIPLLLRENIKKELD
jgi:peptidoglycan/LPS O-acetylase OafA/YrhL